MRGSSMLSPPSRRFSISTSRLTPSTTICTSSTSEKPRRSAFEMSKTPPTAAVSTPYPAIIYTPSSHLGSRGANHNADIWRQTTSHTHN
uniref:Uncharacterized protein n=1 Tax=Labrus bergylta TaxID=56723 RepID=A0A3Q3FI69_9LABR